MAHIKQKIKTVLLSRPGVLQQSLRTMLVSLSDFDIVGFASGGLTALNIVRSQQPALLVIDAIIPEEEILALLRQIRQEKLTVRCLVLIETGKQRAQVSIAGADLTIDRNCSIEQFSHALGQLGF